MLNLKPTIIEDRYSHIITAVESHTCGEPTRIIVSGMPELPGETMIEKKNYFAEHYDDLRTALMYEPRGHKDMFGAVLTEPVREDSDFGIFFIETGGIINMCGHGSIGAATVLVEMGLVDVVEPYTVITFDAPAGQVVARVKVEDGRAVSVSIRNVPSFVYKEGLSVNIDGREIPFDLSFGGSFFTMVDADQFGKEINKETVPFFIDLGMKILPAVNEAVEIHHPELDITVTDVCEFYSTKCGEGADMRNVVVFGKSQADRSPCGTGTSAKLALLRKHGEKQVGESIINESFMGTRFKGEILEDAQMGPYAAVVPEITGTANVTGVSTYLLDERDLLGKGFLIG